MNRLFQLLLAVIAAVPVLACDAPVTAAIVKEIFRAEGRDNVVFVKQTRGVMRPLVTAVTTEARSTVIAEEILADFESRNAETAEPGLPKAIDPKDYTAAGGFDWGRLQRDFPGVNVVVEVSRPGCDSREAFGIVQARYSYRAEPVRPEGQLFHLARQPDGSWKVERAVVADAERLAQ